MELSQETAEFPPSVIKIEPGAESCGSTLTVTVKDEPLSDCEGEETPNDSKFEDSENQNHPPSTKTEMADVCIKVEADTDSERHNTAGDDSIGAGNPGLGLDDHGVISEEVASSLPEMDYIEDIKSEDPLRVDFRGVQERDRSEGGELDFLFPISREYVNGFGSEVTTLGSHNEKFDRYPCRVPDAKKHFYKHRSCHFICHMCNESLSSKKKLRRHLLKHGFMKPIHCQECGKSLTDNISIFKHFSKNHVNFMKCSICAESFESRGDLTNHTSVHIQCRPFTCPSCDDTFETENCLNQHLANHDAPVMCPLCEKNMGTKLALDLHLVHHTVTKPYSCCSFRFPTIRTIALHFKQHVTNEFFNCSLCNKGFMSKLSLNCHNRSLHSEKIPYECKQCGKTYAAQSALTIHVRTHTLPYVCTVCDVSFKIYDQLQHHNFANHISPKKFTCDICGKGLSTEQGLESHMSLHTRNPLGLSQCKICQLEFPSKGQLREHHKTHHNLSCQSCRLKFSTVDALELHTQNVHYNKCKYCDKVFVKHFLLKKHCFKVHGAQRRIFDCPICDKSFAVKSTLKNHVERHTMLRPSCPICNKVSASVKNLQKHMEVHDKVFVCHICGAHLPSNVRLKAHVKLHRKVPKPASSNKPENDVSTVDCTYSEPSIKVEVNSVEECANIVQGDCPAAESNVKIEILELGIKVEAPDESSNNEPEIL